MIYNKPTTKSKKEIIKYINGQHRRDIIEMVGSVLVAILLLVFIYLYFSIAI